MNVEEGGSVDNGRPELWSSFHDGHYQSNVGIIVYDNKELILPHEVLGGMFARSVRVAIMTTLRLELLSIPPCLIHEIARNVVP